MVHERQTATARHAFVRTFLVLAAAGAAACGGKAETGAGAAAGGSGAGSAAGADSGSGAVVTKSVPPTAADSSLAKPATATTGADTNRSGMAVTKGAAKDSQ